jgi:hypothetical protein
MPKAFPILQERNMNRLAFVLEDEGGRREPADPPAFGHKLGKRKVLFLPAGGIFSNSLGRRRAPAASRTYNNCRGEAQRALAPSEQERGGGMGLPP